MPEVSADARALAKELGWMRFTLVGHSMGGMAVQRILADAPDAVEKIVAVAPVPASGVPFDEATWKLFNGAAASDQNRRTIMDYSTGNRLSSSWIDHMVRYSRSTSTEVAFGAYLHSWVNTDFHKEIVGNPVPIKVIVGASDPSLTADVMRATYLAWYPNAELQVIENAGHYPMNETPVALATSIEAFLRG
jgi:pimeloyl-ACP methyl ester carboxylesterase